MKKSRSVAYYRKRMLTLLNWQPAAKRIRFIVCHCIQGVPMLSYSLPKLRKDSGKSKEPCGYYCPTCNFGNAGYRESRKTEIELDSWTEITLENIEKVRGW